MTFSDSFLNLTDREKKALDNSWAKIFADDIFPAIEEQRFSVLYSEKGSRPNTPVNVIVGALIIKELFDYSDDELVENLMLDLHLQYALHTTSFPEQPLSDKTLSRFRKRCYDYETLHNKDLFHDCVKDLSSSIQKLMKINGRIRRMDSMMIESNIRKLSRIELLYTCVSKLAIAIHKIDKNALPESLLHYIDPNDFNQVMYHQRCTEANDRLETILLDADALLVICKEKYEVLTEYDLLVRCLSEQTIFEDGKRRLRTKEDGGLNSKSLQNPSDPDATFRQKAGKEHRGYTANVEETVGPEGSVITDYQYDQNIKSDSSFIKEHLEQSSQAEESTIIVTDGAYYSDENVELAAEKNIQLVTTSLTGTPTPDIFAEFEFNEDGTQVIKCPAGNTPRTCCYRKTNEKCYISFPRSSCEKCPYRNQCNPHFHKQTASMNISKKGRNRARAQRSMKEEKQKYFARLRNGVETVPSNLRKNFHLDKLPRGRQRGKFFFGSKIAALNFRKLFNFKKGLVHIAPNPVFA
jgi:hypothetical protein